jgi:uncharacterized protein YegL
MNIRRLPVYFLLDTSGSMRGEPISSVNVALQSMMAALRQDPHALESVYISMITFDIEAREVLPLTSLEQSKIPEISTPKSGPTYLGAALELLISRIDRDVKRNTAEAKGDWRPLVFIMTDGSPSDMQAFRGAVVEMKKRQFGNIVACAAGPKAKQEYLKEITDQVVLLDTMDSSSFSAFFKWITTSVSVGSSSAGISGPTVLPPPPSEIQIVL